MLAEFKFHHIGVATNSITKTSEYYKKAGYNVVDTIYDPIQKVNISFVNKFNHPSIELIEPASELSPVANILKKSGVTPYHFCYEVENIYEAINKLKKDKFIPLSKPVTAVAIENGTVCFLFNKELGLVELLQVSNRIE